MHSFRKECINIWAEITPRTNCGLHSAKPIATPVDYDRFLIDLIPRSTHRIPAEFLFILTVIMRLQPLLFLLVSFLKWGPETALAEALAGSQQASTDRTLTLRWKATLMTGDDSVDVFDNARKTLKSEFLDMGFIPA